MQETRCRLSVLPLLLLLHVCGRNRALTGAQASRKAEALTMEERSSRASKQNWLEDGEGGGGERSRALVGWVTRLRAPSLPGVALYVWCAEERT